MKSKQTETVETADGTRETPLERMERERDEARKALQEAVDIVEGRARRSPFVAVEEWRELLS